MGLSSVLAAILCILVCVCSLQTVAMGKHMDIVCVCVFSIFDANENLTILLQKCIVSSEPCLGLSILFSCGSCHS